MPPKSKSKSAKSKATSAGPSSAALTASPKLKPATAINVRHILCSKHSAKEAALAQLQSGARFDDVAREMSEDKARQGGALGWKIRGSLLPEFEKVAFALESSAVGAPKVGEVRTAEGYHLVMVEGRR